MKTFSNEQLTRIVLARTPPRVLAKDENYAFYNLNMYGNKVLTWQTPEEIFRSNWKGDVCIRSNKGIARGSTKYNIPQEKLMEIIDAEFESNGMPLNTLTFNQSMPDEHLSIQGEVMRNLDGLCLTYSKIKKPMNLALKEKTERAKGFNAHLILKQELWPASLNELERLLDRFGGDLTTSSSVVEFSAYDIAVGDSPGRNTVIWEVRDY
ncbi:MAG: hypothetical protein Q8L29_02095 [archaeon]|nr:hypothetical protein [archaeon]